MRTLSEPAEAPPEGTASVPGASADSVPCPYGISPEAAQWFFQRLAAKNPAGACTFDGIYVNRHVIDVRYVDHGRPIEGVQIVYSRCAASPAAGGEQLSLVAPRELGETCPEARRLLVELVSGRMGEAPLPSPPSERLFKVAEGLFALAALLGLAVVARALSRRGRRDRRAWIVGAAGLAIALAARLLVPPSMSNWYTDVISPVAPPASGRFGPGAAVLQTVLHAVAPGDAALFGANAVLGALAVPTFVALLRERAAGLSVTIIATLLFALAPLHVRVSASASEHVLASTLTLVAVLAWAHAERARDRLLGLFALSLVPVVALARADAWIQLSLPPLWAMLRDRVEPPARERPRALAQYLPTAIYACTWVATGLAVYWLVVIPSNHPPPDSAGMRMALAGLFSQWLDLGLEAPYWVSPVAALLFVPGAIVMALRRPALLGCALGTLFVAFVPLGRNLLHDALVGARYFLVTFPAFVMVSAFGLAACGAFFMRAVSGGRRFAAALCALLFVCIVWPALPAYRARYAFQDEYTFLRGALGRVPDGCVVYQLPVRSQDFARDLDCCLDAPRSPLSLAFPRLSLRTAPLDADTAGEACVYYYETSACSIDAAAITDPRDLPAFNYYREACPAWALRADGVPEAEAEVSPRSTNGLFGSRPPRVRLLRVRAPGAP